MPFRTIPPGHAVDWHHPDVERSLDADASTVMIVRTVLMADGIPDLDRLTVGIEVLSTKPATEPAPPAASPALPASISLPAALSRRPTEADKRDCLLAIKEDHEKERPGERPPDEGTLHKAMEERLGVTITRKDFRSVRDRYAPRFKRSPGRPRKA